MGGFVVYVNYSLSLSIFKDGSKNFISGLTTAATIWATAAVGIAIGYGMYLIASVTSALLILLLISHHFPFLKKKNIRT